MQTYKKGGFTLIELLVGVLIIGILAAVALPQYQISVDKAKLVQLISTVTHIKRAQEAFLLANGRYATDCEELNADVPAGSKISSGLLILPDKSYIRCYWNSVSVDGVNSTSNLSYELYLDQVNSTHKGGCWSSNKRYKNLCKNICGYTSGTDTNSVCYF